MRFDDSLDTVLAMDTAGPAGVGLVWRQLVDLLGRRRSRPHPAALARLGTMRAEVPLAVRIASARGLERANPAADLVALFTGDEVAVAAPVVRSARLTADEWIALLPAMRPETRGVLRHRRDLSDRVIGALAGFGPDDLTLTVADDVIIPPAARSPIVDWRDDTPPSGFVPPDPQSFVAVADVLRDLPVINEARRIEAGQPSNQDFEIAEIVARIAAHQQLGGDRRTPSPAGVTDPAPTSFRFETDPHGVVRWCDRVERGPLIGLSLSAGRDGAPATADGVAAGALARRARFTDARLVVPGSSSAGGAWRISAAPRFDPPSGRFTGYHGVARRPRADEEPRATGPSPTTDSLRQLVHELRTPANAISGFAEMIERELLGPVASAYRDRAAAIRGQTLGLLEAIDDLDTAARLDSHGLAMRIEPVRLAPLLTRIEQTLQPLAELRGATLMLAAAPDAIVAGDGLVTERMFSRLLTAVVASAAPGETIVATVDRQDTAIRCEVSRPAALAVAHDALFSADAEREAAAPGEPLLGSGFAFRLARNLIAELGGTLTIGARTLTVRLPAAVDRHMEQATV